jgi:N-acetylmuramoyl-L-alanine amidase
MSSSHVVRQGETMSGIAEASGFGNFRVIWDHPKNAALKARRDPHVLFPGDEIFIPDRTEKVESRATDQVHVFAADLPPLMLRVKLLDLDRQPIADARCEVDVEVPSTPSGSGSPAPAKGEEIRTDKEGILEKLPISRKAVDAEIRAHPKPKPAPQSGQGKPPDAPLAPPAVKFDLKIGSLNPRHKLSGQQARLNNLGYFAGFSVRDLDQLLWAAEEFACDTLGKPVRTRPPIVPAPPGGEDESAAGADDRPTGITDARIVQRIEKEHGI